MPTYSYRCECGSETSIVRMMKDHTRTIPCKCGSEMSQIIDRPHVIPDIEPYRSMVTGERIRGRSHHRQHLKQHQVVEVGNEPIRQRKPKPMPPIVPDIKRAIEELRSR